MERTVTNNQNMFSVVLCTEGRKEPLLSAFQAKRDRFACGFPLDTVKRYGASICSCKRLSMRAFNHVMLQVCSADANYSNNAFPTRCIIVLLLFIHDRKKTLESNILHVGKQSDNQFFFSSRFSFVSNFQTNKKVCKLSISLTQQPVC